jgi:hypothetical protein
MEDKQHQEVQVNITLTLSANAELSKSTIIKELKKAIPKRVSNDIDLMKIKIDKIKEEAELYGNE